MATRSFKHYVEQELGKFSHFVIYALLEWVLILVLFVDVFLAFFANEFSRFFELKLPCLFCTRIDHVLVHRAPDFYYNDSVCESHKKQVSCLIYCHNHKKLSDINKMCETCLLSFASEKSSESQTYKPLVRILHHDIDLFANNHHDHHLNLSAGNARKDEQMQAERSSLLRCSCCGEPLKARLKGKGTSLATHAPTPSPRAAFANLRNDKLNNTDLPYTELKFRDNESELHDVEGCPDASSLAKQCREGVKAASVPSMTEAEDTHEDRTPNFGKANKFFGIPLTDSAASSPRRAMRFARKSLLERTELASESGEGHAVNESEGDMTLHQLMEQAKFDPKSLMALYMELDEERSASAIAANNAMAMITKLQAEKAAVQMEALQYQRMMEEQAEYDQEALQEQNDLLAKKDEVIRDLESELDEYREKYGFIREEYFEGYGDEADEDYHDRNSQSFKSFNERSEFISPTISSVDGRTKGDSMHSNYHLSYLSDQNVATLSKFQRGSRTRCLSRLKILSKKPHIFSDSAIRMEEMMAYFAMAGQDSNLMKELLHLHERVKALEADDEFSKHVGCPGIQQDCNREKLLTEISDNLQKLRHLISSPYDDDNDA